MRTILMAFVLGSVLCASQARAIWFTDESTVRSLTVNQDGSLAIRLTSQQCAGALTVPIGDAPSVFSLVMQALAQKRKVRLTSSSTSTSACSLGVVELIP